MSTLDPIQPDQIEGWARLFGIEISLDEAALILEVDSVYRASVAKESERNSTANEGGNK